MSSSPSAIDDLCGWRERKDGETKLFDGTFTPFGTTRAEAEEMIVAARLAEGWITQEELDADAAAAAEAEEAVESNAL